MKKHIQVNAVNGKKNDNDVQVASAIGKVPRNGNPITAHKFGADPYALVFENRVYLYATNDVLEYDDNNQVLENSYGSINKLSVVSSDDLVNWTDHGIINAAGQEGAAKWATQSWAPAAAHKVINGKDKFFLYFANNASGIGLLTSDSPTGPWEDPIGKALILRSTPGVEDVTWLFDPAVLVDDDGKAYIYFGGGVPEGQYEWPDTARVMELGEDMTSVVGKAVPISAPFMFEDAGINKVGNTYYFTYCSNFYDGDRPTGSPPAGEIAYMTSQSPMGPWTYEGTILKNPGHFFGTSGNNHHAIFKFRDQWYIAYHAQTLSKAMGFSKGYRSTHLNQVSFHADGLIQAITADMEGVEPLKCLDPYTRVEAETMAWSAGIQVEPVSNSDLAVTALENGAWTAVANVDFGEGASTFTARICNESDVGGLELRLDHPNGIVIGNVSLPLVDSSEHWQTVSIEVRGVKGIHDLYIIYTGIQADKLCKMDYWQFEQ
ncbi:glycoside hydrolase family 43 protein [Halalkalibacter sp. APA_J-10(15)]|uniref:glycoside hydrolase family 43 protein n=1 Tax=Halalkalibacter sp. APA_J-10(15) TaxID=2933805 RepID=UPI001FF25FB3|nr:glycoside hydrolase family 43 protein [Halalkalibacter sp. APA_J-10(15)]MCK0471002.1 glycoside hydrolase family 43 protein [Halalkalibacter sp. APA_J-10(15)]